MANPWEKDWSTPPAEGADIPPWEREWGKTEATKPAKKERTWAQAAGDTGVDLAKGVVGLGESAVGLADLVTGNLAGQGLAAVGYDPTRTKQALSDLYSDQRQQANRNVSEAKGFMDTTQALIDNPSVIAGGIAESAPMMLGSVGAVRALAGKLLAAQGLAVGSAEAGAYLSSPAVAAKLALAGSATEGAMTAGNIQEQGRQVGRDYTDTAPSALAGGALTAAIGFGTSKIPGFRDAEVGAATAGMGGAQRQGLLATGKEIAKGTFKEGVLEEMPQSAQEQVFTNLALGKPWEEGVSEAAAQGMVVGAAQGGGMNVYSAGRNAMAQPTETLSELPSNSPLAPVDIAQAAINTVAEETQPAQPVVTGQGAGVSQPTQVAPIDPTESEKALLTPVTLTSLDRVNEIDTELAPVRQRLTELTPENGYGPMFDQERLDLTAQAATLDQERTDLAKDWPQSVPGLPSSFTTEAGARVEAQYALMDAADLITSHDEGLRKNPLYPPELQPRERDRAASEMQVSGIVQKLDPARLGLSADAANGAPIVGADGLVESGNARTIALKRVYQAGGQKSEDYKQFLRDNAPQFGITPEAVDGMTKPVLVRVRSTPVNRAEFARQANASTVAAMAPSEQAKSDANRIDSMEDLVPDDSGDFSNAASRPFIMRFMARLPQTEQAGMQDANGGLSTSGYARVRNAVLAKAYGDSPVLARMTESMDDNLRNVSRAFMLAAPKVAAMRSAIKAGNRFDADITPDLMSASEELARIKTDGGSVADALAQTDIMGDQRTPEARQLLQFMNDNMRRPRRMADFISAYMDALEAAGDPKQDSMFGDVQSPTKQDLLAEAEKATNVSIHAPEEANTNEAILNETPNPGTATQGAAQQAGGPAGQEPGNAPSSGSGSQGNGADPRAATQGSDGQISQPVSTDWVEFAPDTGAMGIPRAKMPQVKDDKRPALYDFLKDKGISHTRAFMKPGALKPTQAEYSPSKAENAKELGGQKAVVLASSDGYILDGHHRWVSRAALGEPVDVIKFNAPMGKLLEAVRQFPGATTSNESAEQAQGVDAPAPAAVTDKATPEAAPFAVGSPVAWLVNGKRASGEVLRAPDAKGNATVRATGAEAGAGVRAGGVFNVPLAKLEQQAQRAEPETPKVDIDQAIGDFGPILTQYRHDAQGAIKALTELQSGEAVAALHHPEVGDIDLVWGKVGTNESNGSGLAKLLKWHPEVIGDLQGVISSLKVVSRTDNRIQLESETHKAAVRLEWNGTAKKWLLTAFEKRVVGSGTTTDTTANGVEGDTARLKSDNQSLPQPATESKPAPRQTGTPAPDIRMSRGAGGGMDVGVLEALAARVQSRMPNMPKVNVLASPLDAPPALRDYIEQQGAMDDVDGAMHKGQFYLFASGLPDALRAEHVLAEHEAAHFGLRAILGDSLNTALQAIYDNNESVRQAATELQRRGVLTNTQATEEVIVDIPSSELVKLNGWRKVVQQARSWLADHGFDAMAAKLSAWLDGKLTDQARADLMVANLVHAARSYMAGKRGKQVKVRTDTMLSGTLAEDWKKQEQWLRVEAQAWGYKDIDTLAEKNYPLFEKLAELWRKKNPAENGVLLSRASQQGAPATGPVTPSNPSPLQQLKAKALGLVSAETIGNLIYDYQDKYIDLKNLRDHIKAIGGTITDLNDAYLGEELYHKRLSKRTEDFLADEVKPMLAEMRNLGVTMEAFEEFLHARHAPEANAAMAARNPTQAEIDAGQAAAAAELKALQQQLQGAITRGASVVAIEKALELAKAEAFKWNGATAFKGTEEDRLSLSGMTDDKANAVMAGLSPKQRANMEVLAAKVDAINAKTMDTLAHYGLMDQESLNAWRSAYKFYIPLHRDEAHPDSVSHPIGMGFSVKGDASKRRTGSNAKVTHILGHLAMQREAALTRGEKNAVVKKLYVMAAQNPDKDVWEVDKVPMLTQVDKKTGFVTSYPDPMFKNKPNVVMVRIAGKDAAIVFNEHNREAVRLAGAMKNLDVGDLGYSLQQAARVTRWFAAVNTQYNPVFGLVNFARDVQAGLLNLSTTELAGQQAEVIAGVPAAMRAIYRQQRGKGAVNQENAHWIKLWDEMQEAGGTTGYRDLYPDAKERATALVDELQKLDRGQVSEAAHAVVKWLGDYNDAMENSVRLSAYKLALGKGMSRERSASLAKNLTVNFNRKGSKTQSIGALYAFFNAAIQGNTRVYQTLAGPVGRRIMYGGVALGVVSTMLGMAVMGAGDGGDDEWEAVPEFVKARSVIVPLGHKDYIAIPLPLGFHIFPNMGRIAAEWAMGGKDVTLAKQTVKLLAAIVDATNPVGGGSDLGQVVMPTVMDPMLALWRNQDWTGRPIYRSDSNTLDPTPGFTRAKDSASIFSKRFTEAINKVTGGSNYRPGWWSPTPDQIDYVIGQLTGGLGRELLKAEQVLASPFTGDDLPAHKIPVLGRIYGNTRGAGAQSEQFYGNVKELNEVENELKGRQKNSEDSQGYREAEPLTRLIGEGNALEKQVSQLRKIRRGVVERAEPGYRERLVKIDADIELQMRKLNRDVERVRNGVAAQ